METGKIISGIKSGISHNQFLAIAAVIVIVMGVWLVGCTSTTPSILNPDEKVTRPELNAEISMFKVKVEAAVKDLDQQDLFKQELFNIGLAVAQGGTVNPVGAGVTLLGILGIGAVGDNAIKNKEIKRKTDENNVLKKLVNAIVVKTENDVEV